LPLINTDYAAKKRELKMGFESIHAPGCFAHHFLHRILPNSVEVGGWQEMNISFFSFD